MQCIGQGLMPAWLGGKSISAPSELSVEIPVMVSSARAGYLLTWFHTTIGAINSERAEHSPPMMRGAVKAAHRLVLGRHSASSAPGKMVVRVRFPFMVGSPHATRRRTRGSAAMHTVGEETRGHKCFRYHPTRYLCRHPGQAFPFFPCLLHHQAPHFSQRTNIRPLFSVAAHPDAAHFNVAIVLILFCFACFGKR